MDQDLSRSTIGVTEDSYDSDNPTFPVKLLLHEQCNKETCTVCKLHEFQREAEEEESVEQSMKKMASMAFDSAATHKLASFSSFTQIVGKKLLKACSKGQTRCTIQLCDDARWNFMIQDTLSEKGFIISQRNNATEIEIFWN